MLGFPFGVGLRPGFVLCSCVRSIVRHICSMAMVWDLLAAWIQILTMCMYFTTDVFVKISVCVLTPARSLRVPLFDAARPFPSPGGARRPRSYQNVAIYRVPPLPRWCSAPPKLSKYRYVSCCRPCPGGARSPRSYQSVVILVSYAQTFAVGSVFFDRRHSVHRTLWKIWTPKLRS